MLNIFGGGFILNTHDKFARAQCAKINMHLVKQLFFKHFYSVPINQRLYELQMAKMFA